MMGDTDKVPLASLMEAQAQADDTLRHNEVRRHSRRLFELESRFEHVIMTMDVQQDALRDLIEAREVDRDQIAKLIMDNARHTGELRVIKDEQVEVRKQLASFAESLGGLIT